MSSRVRHAVVARAGLGVAAVAAGRLASRRGEVVGGLDLRERDGVLAEAVEGLLLALEHLPLGVLRDRHPAGLEGSPVRQRPLDALEEGLDVVGGAVPVVHRRHDRRRSEGAVPRGEHHRVAGAHRVPVGTHLLAGHQPEPGEVLRLGLLAGREDDEAAVVVVL